MSSSSGGAYKATSFESLRSSWRTRLLEGPLSTSSSAADMVRGDVVNFCWGPAARGGVAVNSRQIFSPSARRPLLGDE